jgi:hypothetical protein
MSHGAPGSRVAGFADVLLRGEGPLSEWRGAAGAVHDFVSGICINAEKVDLTLEELVVVLHRRLDELADTVDFATRVLDDTAEGFLDGRTQ